MKSKRHFIPGLVDQICPAQNHLKGSCTVKRLAAIVFMLVLLLSCCGIYSAERIDGSPVVPYSASEEDYQDSVEKFKEFVIENGMKLSGIHVYAFDTGLQNVNFYGMVNGEAVMLSLSYLQENLSNSQIQFTCTTLIYLTGYEKQQPGTYYAYQSNTAAMKSGDLTFSAGVNLDPTTYTAESALSFVDIKRSDNSSTATVNATFENAARDGLNTSLEFFSEILKNDKIGLTLQDFGFLKYEVDESRASDIRDAAATNEAAEPAPIDISITGLKFNSAGTPELYLRFTNTGDKDVIAFDFYVRCYNAYGDQIKGYGRYDVFHGTDQDTLYAGHTSEANVYWNLFGFDNVKSVSVAIVKYKIVGEDTVEIPESEYVWIN